MSDHPTQFIGSHRHVEQTVEFSANDHEERRQEFLICLDCGFKADDKHELVNHRCHPTPHH